MEKRYYIAYGSNLNIPQMRMRCPGARIIGTSVIEGYRLLFKGSRTGSYLTIEPQEGACVPVAAWEVSAENEATLDRYEGFPAFYYKKEMELPLKGIRTGKVRMRKVFVYIMHEDRPLGLPSRSYMETCRQGYRSFGIDEAFLERAYADSAAGEAREFPGGWKAGDSCFLVTNRKNGCTGAYTVKGFDGRYFCLENRNGSRSISENVKWGVRKRFQSGEIGAANKHILGYRYDEDEKKYVIIPEEAEAVRWMFQMYIDGVPLREISGSMNRAGIRTTLGNDFQEASVRQLIFNEVYAGDIRRQKCYMADPITKTKVKNCGELPQYYMADCHEAIIDRETYAKVQAEMERRAGLVNPTYPFTGKMKCGVCGNCFTRKKGTIRGKTYVHWICRSKKETGMSCTSVNFSEEELERISARTLGMDEFDGAVFEKTVLGMAVLPDGDIKFRLAGGETKTWKNLHLDPPRHVATVTDCFQGKIRCAACGNTYHRVNGAGKWVYWYCIGKKRKNVECHNPNYTDYKLRQISAYMMGLEEFDEAEFEKRIEEITAFPDGSLEFHFKEGRAEKWQRA